MNCLMAVSLNGTSQYLNINSALATVMPLSFSIWVKPSAVTGTYSCFTISATGSSNGFVTSIFQQSFVASIETAGSSIFAEGGNILANGVWAHEVTVFASATSRTVYSNRSGASNATSATPGGTLNRTTIGAEFMGSSTATFFFPGSIAYPAAWNIALSANDVSNLYNGGNGSDPRYTQSSSLISFTPLQDTNYVDIITGNAWTATASPSIVSDPFVLSAWPANPPIYF
jgi:Concanavalin A-like lectin/glucanases superfamily